MFLGLGLGAVNALGIDEDGLDGVMDAVAYIAALRQAPDLADPARSAAASSSSAAA